jgi:hypothetical protein
VNPRPCCSLALSVTTLPYQSTVSSTLRQPLRSRKIWSNRACAACRERCAGGGLVPARNVILHIYPGGPKIVVCSRPAVSGRRNDPLAPRHGRCYPRSSIWASGNAPSTQFMKKGKKKGRGCERSDPQREKSGGFSRGVPREKVSYLRRPPGVMQVTDQPPRTAMPGYYAASLLETSALSTPLP